ncbi:MAG: uncharacterized membrane protein YgdD (TMEM256/DUF423 family) [Candidatus Azotimanducaceae bacterium]|jgi:uncharacterized membrane protein YgdD (TMEM256/DUF423 family)
MLVKFAITYAALMGAVGVALGAFGAHGLRGTLEPRLMDTYTTAVQYQLFHAIALLITALLVIQGNRTLAFDVSIVGFALGILLFSGSLYGLVFTDWRWFGPVTPLGGLCFIIGWLALAVGGFQRVG